MQANAPKNLLAEVDEFVRGYVLERDSMQNVTQR